MHLNVFGSWEFGDLLPWRFVVALFHILGLQPYSVWLFGLYSHKFCHLFLTFLRICLSFFFSDIVCCFLHECCFDRHIRKVWEVLLLLVILKFLNKFSPVQWFCFVLFCFMSGSWNSGVLHFYHLMYGGWLTAEVFLSAQNTSGITQ